MFIILGISSSAMAAKMKPSALPLRLEQDRVVVTADVLDAATCEDIFGVNLLKRHIQPILIKISNESDRTYGFSKESIQVAAVQATKVARYAYPNPVGYTFTWTKYTTTFVPKTLFNRKTPKRPLTYRDVRQDFTSQEIADGPILPKGHREGFLFLRSPVPDAVHIPLLNTQTSTPLVFELKTAGQSAA